MGFWRSRVLPVIRKPFERNDTRKAAAAEACKSFDDSMEEINNVFEDKKEELQPKVLEIYESSPVEAKTVVKERTDAGLKKHAAAVNKFLEELVKIEFPGAKEASEASAKFGPALVPGPVFFVFEKVATFLPVEEPKAAEPVVAPAAAAAAAADAEGAPPPSPAAPAEKSDDKEKEVAVVGEEKKEEPKEEEKAPAAVPVGEEKKEGPKEEEKAPAAAAGPVGDEKKEEPKGEEKSPAAVPVAPTAAEATTSTSEAVVAAVAAAAEAEAPAPNPAKAAEGEEAPKA